MLSSSETVMTYSQTTGLFTGPDIEGHGYSGHGAGINNPAMQDVHDVGPIPQGEYIIHPPHADPKVGPVAMRLDPVDEAKMFERSDFLIHGDNSATNHSASHGCIILPHDVRVKIGEAVLKGENRFEVTA